MKIKQPRNILTEKEIEQMLEAEMDNHLGYEKHAAEGNNSDN